MGKDLTSSKDRRRKTIGGQLPEEVVTPTGVYQIELRDEATGKTVEVVKSNYVTPLWANFAKHLQVMYPAFYGRAVSNSFLNAGNSNWMGAGQPFFTRGLYPFWPRPLPFQSIVLTDDTSAENTAVHWMRGSPVAWASLWKSSQVPALGRRGQINESECYVSPNGSVHKKVWDWTTTQGNGTYQTAGMAMLVGPNGNDALACGIGPQAIVMPSQAEIQAVVPSVSIYQINSCMMTGGKVFIEFTHQGDNYWGRTIVTDVPAGLFTTYMDGSQLLYDLSGLTWAEVDSGASFPNWTTSAGVGAVRYWGYKRNFCYVPADGDLLWTEPWHTELGSLGRNDLATKTAVWTKRWATLGRASNLQAEGTAFITKLGSFVYVAVPFNSASGGPLAEVWNKQLYRFDYADGANLTLVPLPSGYTVEGGLTTDGTDLILWTNRGIVRMTTAGVITQNFGYPHDAATAVEEQGLSPWPTLTQPSDKWLFKGSGWGMLRPGGNDTRSFYDTTYSQTNTIQIPDFFYSAGGAGGVSARDKGISFHNGRLWMNQRGNAQVVLDEGVGRYPLIGIVGANAFSRALLDIPITKSNTQTMKISYELTFPNLDAWVHDHPTI